MQQGHVKLHGKQRSSCPRLLEIDSTSFAVWCHLEKVIAAGEDITVNDLL